jgi:hypothetical protein
VARLISGPRAYFHHLAGLLPTRLYGPLGYVPPAEHEAAYYRHHKTPTEPVGVTPGASA